MKKEKVVQGEEEDVAVKFYIDLRENCKEKERKHARYRRYDAN